MSVFALTPAGKAYVWGQNASGSLGLGPGTSAIIDRPVPIASGIGDPTNPNPVY
jgi:alpha-tubulin suppressor-like RCC1 family protein